MNLQFISPNPPPVDIIVDGKDDEVVVELDIQNNDRVRIGDRFAAPCKNLLMLLRVTGFKYANEYDNVTARHTHSMREGIVGPPESRIARDTFQKKLATMKIEGELWNDGHQTTGSGKLPERMTIVRNITEDELIKFSCSEYGNLTLGLLTMGNKPIHKAAKIKHNLAGERMVIFGMPGKGKSQAVRGILSQHLANTNTDLAKDKPTGILVLDRAGEYVQDTRSQDNHLVYGLQNHKDAPNRLVIVSKNNIFSNWKTNGLINDYCETVFNLNDLKAIDLIDFYSGFTPAQRDLVSDYAHDESLYLKLLKETKLGQIDKSNWYRDFPGLFELKDKGKELLKEFEKKANDGDELSDDQIASLDNYLSGSKSSVLERAILGLRRFAQQPLLGGKRRAKDIHAVESCTNKIINHLSLGKVVIVDLRGASDDDYTLISALFARRLLDENKKRNDDNHLKVALVMEEAHNILSENELYKGANNKGSVFVELAREGRKYKLGFILVTQQPDVKSIASEIAWTIDSIIAFHMPPDNAKQLGKLKSGLAQYEYFLSNTKAFEGLAFTNGNVLQFKGSPIDKQYMDACSKQDLENHIIGYMPQAT